MVHSAVALRKSPMDLKPSSTVSTKTPNRRKRLSEPRPHPSHCLNKRFWDEVRAGRVPNPNLNAATTSESPTPVTSKPPISSSTLKSPSTTKPSRLSPPAKTSKQSNSRVSAAASTSPPVTIVMTASPNISAPIMAPPRLSIPPLMPPTSAADQFPSFWGFMPGQNCASGFPFQMPPPHGLVPIMPPPFFGSFPWLQPPPPVVGARQPPMASLPPPRQPVPSEQTTDETTNPASCENRVEVAPQIQFVPFPVPIPIPIPLTTDFVLQHFGKQQSTP